MGMPNHIVFVRHGESEANVIQRRDKRGEDVDTVEAATVRERVDYRQRLSEAGIAQAGKAREWIDGHFGIMNFDAYFVSSFFRARETAANISIDEPDIKWEIDDRLDERNWGAHGPLTRAERERLYPVTSRLMDDDPFHAAFEGGESIWSVKNDRVRDVLGTWSREQDGRSLLVVTHGDFIRSARVGIERILPEDYEAIENDPGHKIRNCTILHYARVNPDDADDVQPRITWRRMVYPASPERPADGGQWVRLSGKPRFNAQELLERIENHSPRVLGVR
jgi:broad specificity phosphatase PhoE